MKEFFSLAATVTAVVAALIAVISLITLLKHRTDTLLDGEEKINGSIDKIVNKMDAGFERLENKFAIEIKDTSIRLNAAIQLVTTLHENRLVTDKFYADSLKSIIDKQERMDNLIIRIEQRVTILETKRHVD